MPDVLLEPSVITAHLWGTGQKQPTQPRLFRANDPVFGGGMMVVPRTLPAPTQPSLAVPMVLQPNLTGVTEPPSGHTEYGKAVWFKDHWYVERFQNGCYTFVLAGSAFGQILGLFEATFSPVTRQPCSK